jgi:glutaredoxin
MSYSQFWIGFVYRCIRIVVEYSPTGKIYASRKGIKSMEQEKVEPMILYVLLGCPYCNKVMGVLEDMELEYETIDVPKRKSQREEVLEVSSQRNVPVLNDPNNNIKGMSESDIIVEYLEEQYDYPEGYEEDGGGLFEKVLGRLVGD